MRRSDQNLNEMTARIQNARRLSAPHRSSPVHWHPEPKSDNASSNDASEHSDQSHYALGNQAQRTCSMTDVKSRDLVARFESTQYTQDNGGAPSGFYVLNCSWCEDGYLDSLSDDLRPIHKLHRHVIHSHRNAIDDEAGRYTLSRMLVSCAILVVDGTDEWFESHTNGRKVKSGRDLRRMRSTTHGEPDKRRKSTSQTVPSSSSISKEGPRDASSGKKEENSFGRKSDSSECRICLC